MQTPALRRPAIAASVVNVRRWEHALFTEPTPLAAFRALDIPVLCLRGADSDLLLRETTEQMRRRGPRAVVVEIEGCGHAPALNTPEQFALIERFLTGAQRMPA